MNQTIDYDWRVEGHLLLDQTWIPRGVLLIQGDKVGWSGAEPDAPAHTARETIAPEGAIILPGFIDIHLHGGGGFDYLDGTPEALATIGALHLRHGTTALCPTLLSHRPAVLLHGLAAIRAAAGASHSRPGAGPRILGAHLEGPFLNPQQAGAHPVRWLRPPDPVLLEELLAAAGDALRIVTLAPELPGALDLVERLIEHNVIVAMGHSNATYEEAQQAITAGCSLATHTFNAMRGIHHREIGLSGAALLSPMLVAEAIADGHHLSPPALELLWRLKGPQHLALVTDAVAALETEPDRARLGDQPVQVTGGVARLADGTIAGSILTMEQAVRNLVHLARAPLAQAAAAASVVPARLLGLPCGLQAGSAADLVLFDQQLQVRHVFVGGQVSS